jgi:V/A-type H+-transporting ATPase subunit D
MEVKKSRDEAAALALKLEQQIATYHAMRALWNEFDPTLISVGEVKLRRRKIAGVVVPQLDNIELVVRPFSIFDAPAWYADGVKILKDLATIGIEREVTDTQLALLEHARKKTTQKVNLFEKVQIPGYQDAIRKIKRFMEDEENLSKSSQKIMRAAQEKHRAAQTAEAMLGEEADML